MDPAVGHIQKKKGMVIAMANLTARELSALEDELSAEQLLIKKYKTYAVLSTDPQIKTQCEQIPGRHQNHFDRLMGFLN